MPNTPLSKFEIEALLNATETTDKWFDGQTWHKGKPPADRVGSFSTTRSGDRRYLPEHNVLGYRQSA